MQGCHKICLYHCETILQWTFENQSNLNSKLAPSSWATLREKKDSDIYRKTAVTLGESYLSSLACL